LAGNASPIQVLNPIASPLAVMRSSLVGGLVEVLRTNLTRKAERVRVFEVGRVFRRDPTVLDGNQTVAGLDQPVRVCGLSYGPADALQWGQDARQVDFFDLKGDVEALLAPVQARFEPGTHPACHPGRCARVIVAGVDVGFVGELHPKWRQAYDLPQAPVLFELDAQALVQRPVPACAPVPKMQSVFRDLSLVVSEQTSYDALMAAVMQAPTGGLVRGSSLFDIYTPKAPVQGIGEGERSLAVRLELRDDEQTLTDERIDAAMKAVVDALGQTVLARVRAGGQGRALR
jgi:phenylalanyl-tRNA synthetase beta chain